MPKPVLLGGAAGVLLLLLGGGTWFALWPSPPKPALLAEPSRLAAAPSLPNLPPAEPPPEAQKLPIPDAALSPAQPNDPAKLPTNEITTPETKRPENTIEPPRPPLQPVPDRMAMTLPNQAAIRDAFASLARSARCALPRFSVSDEGRISVSGLVGAGAPSAALRDAVQTTAPGAALIWEARAIDGPYCEIFDIIRPIAQPSSPFLGLALKNETTHLKEHDLVLPILKLPEFPAYLQVDYFSHDGSVAHLFPIRGVPNMTFAANATVPLGNSSNDRVEVGPPFGTDVIVAIASSVPLFPPGRIRDDETVQTYLPALKAAIEAAQRQKGKVTGRALVLETVP